MHSLASRDHPSVYQDQDICQDKEDIQVHLTKTIFKVLSLTSQEDSITSQEGILVKISFLQVKDNYLVLKLT